MTDHGVIHDDLDDLRNEMCARCGDCKYCEFDGKEDCKLTLVIDTLVLCQV